MRPTLLTLLGVVWLSSVAAADDKVVLRDGREIEGTILSEDADKVVMLTARGKRVYRRTRIRHILRADVAEEAAEQVAAFLDLPVPDQQLRNARAEYLLGRYDAVVQRLEPLVKKGVEDPPSAEARWLLIEAYERLASFGNAENLLKAFKEKGSESDRVRAQAHLDLFEQNPGYKLERVNSKLARKFLTRELRLQGKQKNALADQVLMRKALEEYVGQILDNKKVSLGALKQRLDPEETIEALEQMPAAARVEKYLPYYGLLTEVEESLTRAAAVLPGYADGYVLDLMRTEADHLNNVVLRMFNQVLEDYPENASYAYDPANGKLTKEGREQWRENCEEYLAQSKPLTQVSEYLIKKVGRHPRELRRLKQQIDETLNRLKRTREAISRKKDTRIYV
ncbi:MAG: hypothetical protein GY778_14625 [bacterium]|nr:hypothetical protein [bacterium]